MPRKNKKKKQDIGTQDFVEIKEIRGPVVILKDGSLRAVIKTEATNFELKSSDEKNAIIQGFQNFLNLVDFPIQIAISSKRLDLSKYLNGLNEKIAAINNEMLRVQAVEYSRFVGGLSEMYDIMSKKFFIIIPYYGTEMALGSKQGLKDKLKALFGAVEKKQHLSDQELERYVGQMEHRVALIRNGIERIGIRTEIMDYESLAYLYRSYYNPKKIWQKKD